MRGREGQSFGINCHKCFALNFLLQSEKVARINHVNSPLFLSHRVVTKPRLLILTLAETTMCVSNKFWVSIFGKLFV